MPHWLIIRCALAAMLGVVASAAQAEEVAVRHKGLTLNAALELAANKTVADGVILIVHGGLAHRDVEIITSLRGLLQAAGHSTLAINLSLGLDDRHGMYDCKVTHRHRHDDAVEEIGVWVDWLKARGARRVTLLGHSCGGAQAALYAAERDDALVGAVVLLAPRTRTSKVRAYRRRHGTPLAPRLRRATALVRTGKGGTVLERVGLLFCKDTSVTAEALVSYYSRDLRLDTPDLIARLERPTLVVVAGDDRVAVGPDKVVAPPVDGERVRVTVIDGADHFFLDLYAEDAVEEIDAFLGSTRQ